MTKQEFDKIFNECNQEIIPQAKDRILKEIEKHSYENGRINTSDIPAIVYTELMKYCNELLYSVLFKIHEVEE